MYVIGSDDVVGIHNDERLKAIAVIVKNTREAIVKGPALAFAHEVFSCPRHGTRLLRCPYRAVGAVIPDDEAPNVAIILLRHD